MIAASRSPASEPPPFAATAPITSRLFPSDAGDLPAAPVPSFAPEAGEHAIRVPVPAGDGLAGEFGPELRRGDCLTGDGGRAARIVQRREVRGEGAIFQRPHRPRPVGTAGEERIEAGEGAGRRRGGCSW